MKATMGKLGYGALFLVVIPALLIAWARALAPQVTLPEVRSPLLGGVLAVAGTATLSAGWWALWVHGGGLPMNAFPPPSYVRRGIYGLLSHPIYVGFCAIVVGMAIATGSASGLWIVAPVSILACVGLVQGYERHDLVRRFGAPARPWMRLPPREAERPTWGDRLFAWICVMLAWGAIYEAIALLGPPRDAISTALPFEQRWPVLEWSEAIYASVYLVVLLAPLLVRTRAALRALCVRALLAMALVFPLYLALPFVSPPRPFDSGTWLGLLLAHERAFDTPACAFPSFHVVWALLVADALANRSRLWKLWAAAVILSCVGTGMHTVLDLAGGVAAVFLVRHAADVWDLLRGMSERIANSWREWRFGPVRIINHGLWAGLGAAVALAIIGAFAGPRGAPVLCVVWLCTLVGSALWAQWIEGASGLSRPYGFWGGLLGAAIGGLLAGKLGANPAVILAATCVSAPFAQSFGRLRCLVQGCCHGSLAPPSVGIRYRHPRSRVGKVSGLAGRPLHPTPLYSILWNVVVALAVGRLASLHASAHLVVGFYLILTGAGRFVEESYRGEPQTPIVAGLRVYQWVALTAMVAGALITALGHGTPVPSPSLRPESLALALAGGLLSFVAFGVDFPEASWRFSRLA